MFLLKCIEQTQVLTIGKEVRKAFLINYIPTLSKPHTYSLLALYPCATQADGEFLGYNLIFMKFEKGTLLGGKYGTQLDVNYSRINGLNENSFLNDNAEHNPMLISSKGEELYFFEDFLILKSLKKSAKIKTNLC